MQGHSPEYRKHRDLTIARLRRLVRNTHRLSEAAFFGILARVNEAVDELVNSRPEDPYI